jgi:hypothetical protein
MGTPQTNDAVFMRAGVALTGTAAQTTTIPATGVLSRPTTTGKIRVKIYGGAAAALTSATISASDGTNTCLLGMVSPVTLSATAFTDQVFDYLVDSATGPGAGGGAVGQMSAAVGGATSFSVITTLASGTASMDVEICPVT